ncbi:MAG: MerR family transcriptional regulator [Proteobacteria bacterium]|nr:MerR family transcriptional regulator [Pseudomonadota bacterium]
MNSPSYTIAAVERDTGLSKDVLRMWERRYGFPVPERDGHGERLYPAAQVERLCAIKRLMDQGYRPGKLIAMPVEELSSLAPRRGAQARTKGATVDEPGQEELLTLLRQHDANGFVQALQQQLARQGLQRFVQDIVAPLTQQVGDAWEDGNFEVFEEHLFTELTKRVLRQAVASLPQGRGSPRVLLTSVPDEQHMLGLLMVEALLALEGAECIPLGAQMPVLEISRAAAAHRADIVALSFSVAFPARQLPKLLEPLRAALPADIELWVGGSGVLRLNPPAGVRRFSSLDQGVEALAAWRSEHAG